MEIGNVIVCLFLSYYTLYILQMLFSLNSRKSMQESNLRMDELRKVGVKTLNEQKEFIDMKYPKRNPFKWTARNVLNAAIYIIGWAIAFMLVYSAYGRILERLKIGFGLSILFVMVFPIVLNIILKRFHLEKDDLGAYIRGWRK